MKQTRTCVKCKSKEIIRVPASAWFEDNKIPVGFMAVVKTTRYICCDCGFVEEWIQSAVDREKLRERAKKSENKDGE
jgi:hypothetical protein